MSELKISYHTRGIPSQYFRLANGAKNAQNIYKSTDRIGHDKGDNNATSSDGTTEQAAMTMQHFSKASVGQPSQQSKFNSSFQVAAPTQASQQLGGNKRMELYMSLVQPQNTANQDSSASGILQNQ